MTKAEIAQQLARNTGPFPSGHCGCYRGFYRSHSPSIEQRATTSKSAAFGTFKVVERAPRTGRNPKAGATIAIPKRKTPTFKPSNAVKNRIVQRQS